MNCVVNINIEKVEPDTLYIISPCGIDESWDESTQIEIADSITNTGKVPDSTLFLTLPCNINKVTESDKIKKLLDLVRESI